MRPILIYSNENEPVAKIVLEQATELGVLCVSLSEVLSGVEVNDQISLESQSISWKLPSGEVITNADDVFVINRAFYPSPASFKAFAKEDREYAQNEFWAYLMWALSSFEHISERPNLSSLTGGALSLSTQWHKVKRLIPGLSVPEYIYGPLSLVPSHWKQTVFTEPYSYYFWRANQPPDCVNVFAFQRDLLKSPILVLVAYRQAHIISRGEFSVTLSDQQQEAVKNAAIEITQSFGYFISELLFFKSESELFFGMIHNSPAAASFHEEFAPGVKCAIIDKLDELRKGANESNLHTSLLGK